MINRISFNIILLMILTNSISCYPRNLVIDNCEFINVNDTLHINITVTNNSMENFYLPLQYWEVELIKEGNKVLAYPYEDYAVNRIYIYSNEFNSLKSTGSKCCFPVYEYLPYFAILPPDTSTVISIKIATNSKLVESTEYKAEICLQYYNESTLKSQLHNFDGNSKDLIINNHKISIQIGQGVTNLLNFQSTFIITSDILIKNNSELNAICE